MMAVFHMRMDQLSVLAFDLPNFAFLWLSFNVTLKKLIV